MELLQAFMEHIRARSLFYQHDHLIVAVSGGVDSIVLSKLCKDAGYSISMAHCNFQLRGKESDRDEAFVKAWAKSLGVPFHLERFDTNAYAQKLQISTQEAARELRYEWFQKLVDSQKSKVDSQTLLLTAHHADDNAETLLMNFCRGTGLDGLKGIPETRGYIRRPLLPFSRSIILDFAREKGLDYVEDSSNQSSKYTRNFFRNEIIPLLTQAYPQVSQNLLENARRFSSIAELYHLAVTQLLAKISHRKGNEIHIPIRKLLKFNNRALIYEWIHSFGFSEKQVDELIKLAAAPSGRYIENERWRIIRHRHWLIVAAKDASQEGLHFVIEGTDRRITFPDGILQLKSFAHKPGKDKALEPAKEQIATLDSQHIEFPILLRKWKAGDYFYPLGMKKKKKLARFFIDQKLSKTEKEKIWVLESDRKILWVLGQRLDDRFKITEKTTRALQLAVEWNKLF